MSAVAGIYVKVDGWLVVQSLLLPEFRQNLPRLFQYLDQQNRTEAAQLIRQQVLWVEGTIGRKLDLDFDGYSEMIVFLLRHRTPLVSRANTLMMRAKE